VSPYPNLSTLPHPPAYPTVADFLFKFRDPPDLPLGHSCAGGSLGHSWEDAPLGHSVEPLPVVSGCATANGPKVCPRSGGALQNQKTPRPEKSVPKGQFPRSVPNNIQRKSVPKGTPLTKMADHAWKRVLNDDIPAEVSDLDGAARRLAALCSHIQDAKGDQPFGLSVREAARLLGVSKSGAGRLMRSLVGTYLQEVSKGTYRNGYKSMSSEFRYVGRSATTDVSLGSEVLVD
jgi:hypothetical protein